MANDLDVAIYLKAVRQHMARVNPIWLGHARPRKAVNIVVKQDATVNVEGVEASLTTDTPTVSND